MAWHTPHCGEHGWVLNPAGDYLLVDHAVALGLRFGLVRGGSTPLSPLHEEVQANTPLRAMHTSVRGAELRLRDFMESSEAQSCQRL